MTVAAGSPGPGLRRAYSVGHSTRGFAYFRRMTDWRAEKEFGVTSALMKGYPPLDGA